MAARNVTPLLKRRHLRDRSVRFPHGRHSIPHLVHIDSRRYVSKRTSWKKLTKDQANLMVTSIWKYWRQLRKTGIKQSKLITAKPVSIKTAAGENKYAIKMLETYVGPKNLNQLFHDSPLPEVIPLYSKLVGEGYKSVSISLPNKPVKSAVLTDSKPKNWVLGKDGKVRLVDFYSPKLLDANGEFYPWVPHLHARIRNGMRMVFQDKRAVFHILLAYSVAVRPELRKEFEQTLLTFLEKQKEDKVARYIKNIIKRDYRVTSLANDRVVRAINLGNAEGRWTGRNAAK